MTFDEYEKLAARTRGVYGTKQSKDAILNAALGTAGEAGEIADAVKKWAYHGKTWPRENLIEEIGDVLWYLSWLAEMTGASLEQCAEQNIAKLASRHAAKIATGG